METQLVRLDAPYNVIFGNNGRFGLHIATLIVVDEMTEGKSRFTRTELRSRSYPVVSTAFDLEGNVWMGSELKSCLRICRQNETITLYTFKQFMDFCDAKGMGRLYTFPMSFNIAMMSYGIKLNFSNSSTGRKISDFEVELLFDEDDKSIESYRYGHQAFITDGLCMVHTGSESPFYFWSAFPMDEETPGETIEEMTMLRDSYLHAFQFDGLKSITFTTKDQKYQDFVDKLNNTPVEKYG
jgi:hypothetical protein